MPVIVVKSGTKWFVPPDCRSATIEAVGAGGVNGGSYAKSTNVSLTPGSVVDISIGAGGSGGKTWLNTVSTIRYTPKYITWSGTQFVALDDTNNIIVSPDGSTWTQKPGITSIFNTRFLSIAADGLNIVVVPEGSGATQFAISNNGGNSWTAINPPIATFVYYPVKFVNGIYTTSGFTSPTLYEFISTDNGASWSISDTRNVNTTTGNRVSYITGNILYINSLYIAAGSYINIASTTYGIGYSSSPSGAQTIITAATIGVSVYQNINAIAYGAGVYVVIGNGGVIRTASTLSNQASAWTGRTSGTILNLVSIIYDGTKFIVSATGGPTLDSGYIQVLTSTNGIDWSLNTTSATEAGNSILLNTAIGIYLQNGLSIAKTTNSGSTWDKIFIGDGSPLSASTGISAAGSAISPLAHAATSIYTAAVNNFFYGGLRGLSYTAGCSGDYRGGAGGAAGPNGNGGSGFDASFGGGAGGAANNSNANAAATYTAGGISRFGDAGGATSFTVGVAGGNGTNGSGGGGGQGDGSGIGTNGGNGSLEVISAWTDFTGATYGIGSGAGGGSSNAGDYGLAAGPGGGGTGTLGQGLLIITYTSQPLSGTYTQVLTSSQNVYIPPSVTSLTAHTIGPGSQGGNYSAGLQNGGGAGAYSASTIITPASGAGYVNVPSASVWGVTADSWFRVLGNTAPTASSQGALAKGALNGTGGSSALSIGGTVFSGGSGGASIQPSTRQRGGGGGGAAGPAGIGKNGGAGYGTSANTTGGGGGGGAANAGISTVGGIGTATVGGQGGTGPTGTPGGTGATISVLASAGSNGSGGGAGAPSTSTATTTFRSGANGSQQAVWTINGINYGPGAGGGGGGIGTSGTLFGDGGNAGGYGAGGGAASGSGGGTRGNGTQGLVILIYTVVGTAAPTSKVYYGATNMTNIRLGSTSVKSIYYGSIQVY